MFELKKLTADGIEAALDKADQHRLLNEAWEAESICRDVLEINPSNRRAIGTLILSLTDQFGDTVGQEMSEARKLLAHLDDPYERNYYEGLICERRGKSLLAQGAPGCGPIVHDWLCEAMECYERAEPVRPAGNDDVLLRWNTCARLIHKHDHLQPAPRNSLETMLE